MLSPGQTVVHPHHGPASVRGITERKMRGERREYVELRVLRTDMEVMVPMDQVGELGLRPVSTHAEIDEVLAVLQAPTSDMPDQWSRRMKANTDKVRLGDLRVTAEVVRDLTRRQADKGISTGERDLLRDASEPILAEIGLALSLTDEQAEAALEKAILGEERVTAADLARSGQGAHPELAAS